MLPDLPCALSRSRAALSGSKVTRGGLHILNVYNLHTSSFRWMTIGWHCCIMMHTCWNYLISFRRNLVPGSPAWSRHGHGGAYRLGRTGRGHSTLLTCAITMWRRQDTRLRAIPNIYNMRENNVAKKSKTYICMTLMYHYVWSPVHLIDIRRWSPYVCL